MLLPKIWGSGNIFTFSALDGECTPTKSLTGTLSGDKIGINFLTDARCSLCIEPFSVCDVSYSVVTSDIIKGVFTTNSNEKYDFEFVFTVQNGVLIRCPKCAHLRINFAKDAKVKTNSSMTIYNFDNEKYALMTEKGDDYNISMLSFGNNAEDILKNHFTNDINCEVSKKLMFFNDIPVADELDDDTKQLYYKCFSVIKSSIFSPEKSDKPRWTVMDKTEHKNTGAGGSILNLLGLKYISYDLAKEVLSSVFDAQNGEGMIEYFSPGCNLNITQPPILTWCILNLYKYSNDKSLLENTYDKLKKYIQWIMENRDVNKNYLYEWAIDDTNLNSRCEESGMDNSPRFDSVTKLDSIDFSCFVANEIRCLAHIANILDKQGEHLYWDVIYDRIKKAINDVLYCEDDGFYYDVLVSDNSFKKIKTSSAFLTLFAGVCDKDTAHNLVKYMTNEFNTPFGIASVSPREETFSCDMCRGGVLIGLNYFIAQGLKEYGFKKEADEIILNTIKEVTKWYKNDGTVYEYYDAMSNLSPSRLDRKGAVVSPYMPYIKTQAVKDYAPNCSLIVEMIIKNIIR